MTSICIYIEDHHAENPQNPRGKFNCKIPMQQIMKSPVEKFLFISSVVYNYRSENSSQINSVVYNIQFNSIQFNSIKDNRKILRQSSK